MLRVLLATGIAAGALLSGSAPVAAMTCPAAGDGEIRVGVVVDHGTGAVGVTCVVLPEGSTGLDALHARARELGRSIPRQDDSGLLCAIDDVPAPPACGSPSGGGYAYWSYWIGSGSGWTYSSRGPAFRRLRDGDVEGWRFLDTGTGAGSERSPRVPVSAGRPPAPSTPTTAPPAAGGPAGPSGGQPVPPVDGRPRPTATSPNASAGPSTAAPVPSSTTPTTAAAPSTSTSTTAAGDGTATTTEPAARVLDERATAPAQVDRPDDPGNPGGAIAGAALISVLAGAGWAVQRRRARAWSERARDGS